MILPALQWFLLRVSAFPNRPGFARQHSKWLSPHGSLHHVIQAGAAEASAGHSLQKVSSSPWLDAGLWASAAIFLARPKPASVTTDKWPRGGRGGLEETLEGGAPNSRACLSARLAPKCAQRRRPRWIQKLVARRHAEYFFCGSLGLSSVPSLCSSLLLGSG